MSRIQNLCIKYAPKMQMQITTDLWKPLENNWVIYLYKLSVLKESLDEVDLPAGFCKFIFGICIWYWLLSYHTVPLHLCMENKMNRLIYAYPLELKFTDLELQEYFVTLDEPNLFVEPYDSLWIKLAATVTYLIGLAGSFIQYSFVLYEANGYLASFRTAINQLVSSGYFIVSFKPFTYKVFSKQFIFLLVCLLCICCCWIRLT